MWRACLCLALFLTTNVALAETKPRLLIPPDQPPVPSGSNTNQPNQPQTGAAPAQIAQPEPRGTESNPAIVKIIPAEKTPVERQQEEDDRREKSSSDWWIVFLTGALALVGVLQFLALIGQMIVFRMQAKQLRESINLTREIASRQETDMSASIAEAARAAYAMEGVATGIAGTLENARDMAATQREFWSTQMRAYVFIQSVNIFNVADPPIPPLPGQELPLGAIRFRDRGPLIRAEIRNTGHTPANNLIHIMSAAYREFPLTAPLPEIQEAAVNPNLVSVFSIAPGGVTTKNHIMAKLTEDQIQGLRQSTHGIYIFGRIRYTDIFGNEHVTNYRYRHNELTGAIGVTAEVSGTESGNDST